MLCTFWGLNVMIDLLISTCVTPFEISFALVLCSVFSLVLSSLLHLCWCVIKFFLMVV